MPSGEVGEPPESAPPSRSFEQALEQLETTVGRLEEGELPLEEALALFESGVALSRECSATLEAAEQRIEVLLAERGDDAVSWETREFDYDALDVVDEDEADED